MKIRIVPVAAGLAAAAGIAITGASLANAAPATSTAATAYTAPQQNGEMPNGQPPRGNGNTDPSKPMRSDEKLLTGDVAAKVTAAAKKKEPTATVQRVETDSDGVYEAHMVRTDGTQVIVQIDKSYAVTNVQVMGQGGPAGSVPAERAGPSRARPPRPARPADPGSGQGGHRPGGRPAPRGTAVIPGNAGAAGARGAQWGLSTHN